MVVGDTCVGKTRLLEVLQKALTSLHDQGNYSQVFSL